MNIRMLTFLIKYTLPNCLLLHSQGYKKDSRNDNRVQLCRA